MPKIEAGDAKAGAAEAALPGNLPGCDGCRLADKKLDGLVTKVDTAAADRKAMEKEQACLEEKLAGMVTTTQHSQAGGRCGARPLFPA